MGFKDFSASLGQAITGNRHLPWMVLVIVVGVFTVLQDPNIVADPYVFEVGDVVPHNIKSPRDFFIEDRKATSLRRKQAADAIATVYDLNAGLSTQLAGGVQDAFDLMQPVFKSPVPKPPPAEKSKAEKPVEEANNAVLLPPEQRAWRHKEDFESRLGISLSSGAYKVLIKERFKPKIATDIIRIIREIIENGVVANKSLMMQHAKDGMVFRDIDTQDEQPGVKIKHIYGLDQAGTMVRVIGQPLLKSENYLLRNLIVDAVQKLIRPNISLNSNETEKRRKLAADREKPVLYQIKKGEMLLREGDRVTETDLEKLAALTAHEESENKSITSALGAGLLFFCLLLTIYWLTMRYRPSFQRHVNKNLLFVSLLLILFLLCTRAASYTTEALAQQGAPFNLSADALQLGLPLASVAMTACLFVGLELAITLAVLVAVSAVMLLGGGVELMVYFLISGGVGAYWVKNCRERKVFIKAGLILGLVNALLSLGMTAYGGNFTPYGLLWHLLFAFLGGVGAGIITAGLAPLVEMAFGYTTDITLLELANLDRPLLRKLMMEAPGTYHHSMVVGSMVEAAAADIGANPLLAKVSGYYHDIGKMTKPLYFIENQKNERNPHDKLAPSMSKRILIAHVKDGVELAQKNKLGPVIVDAIMQSHGTSLITYFYNKAKQRGGEGGVNSNDYRYPGPKPQTREGGLVMLADVVEAASRTLEDPTPARIQGLVQKLINKVFSEGELGECELTLKDLHTIAKVFNRILTGIHHHRVVYPDGAQAGNGKEKNGHSDRQSSNGARSAPERDPQESADHLKRLGLS